MKRKFLKFAVCELIILLLIGCGKKDQGVREDINYNQYIYTQGSVAYTDKAYIFLQNNQLMFLEPTLSAPLTRMCIRPDCLHLDSSCSSYVSTSSIFAANNQLYYLEKNEENHYELYKVDLNGGNRKAVKKIPILDKERIGFAYRVYDNYLALEVIEWVANTPRYAIYLTDYTNEDAEIVPIFGGNENSTVCYTGISLRENWVFVRAYDIEKDECTYMGYNISEQKSYKMIDDWEGSNTISLKDNTLYWVRAGEGFYSMSLEDFTVKTYRNCDPNIESGLGIYDDQFIYLTNTVPPLDAMDIVPEKERGLRIYDYYGNLIQFIPTYEQGIYPTFLLSTPQYVFFCNNDLSGEMIPKWYMEKSKIATGNAVLIPLE